MIDDPEIVKSKSMHTAVIRLTIPRQEIENVMGPAFEELLAALAAQGIEASGPFFSHHLKMQQNIFDFEVGIPVSTPVSPAGRVKPGRLPSCNVARTVYQGSYEGLGDAWSQLHDWIDDQDLVPARNLWESYLIGPASSENPEDWLTQLNCPLIEDEGPIVEIV